MKRKLLLASVPGLALMLAGLGSLATAQEVPREYQEILTTLGKKGDFKDHVLMVNIPRQGSYWPGADCSRGRSSFSKKSGPSGSWVIRTTSAAYFFPASGSFRP